MILKKWGAMLSLSFVLVLVNCGGGKEVASGSKTPVHDKGGNKPGWAKSRPIDFDYYIGIAVASKSANPSSYALVAQRNALNEMASQIEVQVKSNSMLFSFEDQNQFNDEFKEFIQVKANQQIGNYEEVASWETDFEYWVYYRLSKEQYRKDKEAKIQKAIDLSVGFLNQAEAQENAHDYTNAMKLYFKAFGPIKLFLGEPLQVIHNDSEVYLGNFLFDKISSLAHKFSIKPNYTSIKAVWGGEVTSKDLTFKVSDDMDRNVLEMPVSFEYSEGIIRPRSDISNFEGEVFTEIKKISNTEGLQEVQAKINFKKLITSDRSTDEATNLILEKLYSPVTSININVVAPSIFVFSNELEFALGSGNTLKDAFISQASVMGFNISSNKKTADIIVEIKTDTKKSGVTYDLSNTYLNGSVVITQQSTGSVIYQDKLTSIKGVSSSFKLASKEAYKKGSLYIIEKIVPRFYRKYVS